MTSRLCLTVALTVLAACQQSLSGNDGGDSSFDAGNPDPRASCSGGCAENQVCDAAKRICVSGCTAGCDGGTCLKVGDAFQCTPPVAATCGGMLCAAGQTTCIDGQCSCLTSSSGAGDTCTPFGKWCSGRACENPKSLEQCQFNGPSCPAGNTCTDVFGPDRPICTRRCQANSECNPAERCFNVGCLPIGFANGFDCSQFAYLPDGGVDATDAGPKLRTVPVSNTCLLRDEMGAIANDQGRGSGNCIYSFVKFADGLTTVPTCVGPGSKTEGQACKTDRSSAATATRCATGLQCFTTTGQIEGDGVCLRSCNANPPKFGLTPTPACASDETCVNQFRLTDPNDNAVGGVCMKSCDVFDPMHNTCPTKTSCVPTSGDGSLLVSLDGKGMCVPQQSTLAAQGASCAQTDPFRGASCGSGQVCASRSVTAGPKCLAVCDLSCVVPVGGMAPARCATQPNAGCAGGTTCKRVTSTSGANVGYCE